MVSRLVVIARLFGAAFFSLHPTQFTRTGIESWIRSSGGSATEATRATQW